MAMILKESIRKPIGNYHLIMPCICDFYLCKHKQQQLALLAIRIDAQIIMLRVNIIIVDVRFVSVKGPSKPRLSNFPISKSTSYSFDSSSSLHIAALIGSAGIASKDATSKRILQKNSAFAGYNTAKRGMNMIIQCEAIGARSSCHEAAIAAFKTVSETMLPVSRVDTNSEIVVKN